MGVRYKYKKAEASERDALINTIGTHMPENLPHCAPCHRMGNKMVDLEFCRRLRFQSGVLNYTVSHLQHWDDASKSQHVFIFPGGDRQRIFPNWREVIPSSIHLVVEGNPNTMPWGGHDPCFGKQSMARNNGTDIVIPGGGNLRMVHKRRDILPIDKKPIFASYCGSFDKPERRQTQKLFKALKRARQRVVFVPECPSNRYRKLMTQSIYCFSPAGSTPWTSRLYAALAQGCIPVLLNQDLFDVPFGLVEQFSKI
eukprot:scaffold158433_cov45-Prasinocladus_malaysianus.AAC.1